MTGGIVVRETGAEEVAILMIILRDIIHARTRYSYDCILRSLCCSPPSSSNFNSGAFSANIGMTFAR